MQFKRTALTLLAVASVTAALAADSPCGPWHGRLSVGLQRLRVVFDIGIDGTCTFDSPDQGATGLPAELRLCTSDSLVVEMPGLNARFAGKVGQSAIVGRFTQGAYTFPLTLKPGTASVRRPQTPKAPFPYSVEDVAINAGDAVLSATLTRPAADSSARAPLVVLVSGSGLQNRDEEILSHRPFAVMADWLARNGIASLRYDDRGFARSTGSNDSATTITYAADAAAAVEYARSIGEFASIGVLGHSEGGTIAFMLGARGCVDFVISMAGPAICGRYILLAQNRAIMIASGMHDSVVTKYCDALGVVLDGGCPSAADTESLPERLSDNLVRVAGSMNPWIKHFVSYSPAGDISAVRCPVFAFNGSLDMQVDAAANLGAIRRHLPAGEHNVVRCYEGLNHLMQHCSTGFPSEYGTIEETIAPEVLADIAAWISSLQ